MATSPHCRSENTRPVQCWRGHRTLAASSSEDIGVLSGKLYRRAIASNPACRAMNIMGLQRCWPLFRSGVSATRYATMEIKVVLNRERCYSAIRNSDASCIRSTSRAARRCARVGSRLRIRWTSNKPAACVWHSTLSVDSTFERRQRCPWDRQIPDSHLRSM